MLTKFSIVLLPGLIIVLSCASSKENSPAPEEQHPNLIQLTPPPDNSQISKIYIDSARVINVDNKPSLLISGTFPDGCTQLSKAEHNISNGNISITLESWRDPDKMCTQALVSFSFIYQKIPVEILRNTKSVEINGEQYKLN